MKVLSADGLTKLIQLIKSNFFSTSDGQAVSSVDIENVTSLGIDSTPTSGSSNLVTSGGVYTAVGAKSAVSVSSTGTATDEVSYIIVDGTEKKLASGFPSTATAGDAIIYNGTEWSKQSGYGYRTTGTNFVAEGSYTLTETETGSGVYEIDVPYSGSSLTILNWYKITFNNNEYIVKAKSGLIGGYLGEGDYYSPIFTTYPFYVEFDTDSEELHIASNIQNVTIKIDNFSITQIDDKYVHNDIFVAEYGVSTSFDIIAAVMSGQHIILRQDGFILNYEFWGISGGKAYFVHSDLEPSTNNTKHIYGQIIVDASEWTESEWTTDYLEHSSNKVTSLSSSSTDVQYPSAKAVYDLQNTFIADYGNTTYAEITTALNEGKAVFVIMPESNGEPRSITSRLLPYMYSADGYHVFAIPCYVPNDSYYMQTIMAVVTSSNTWQNQAAGDNLESTTRKITSLSSSSTDDEYPSAKSVYDKFATLDGNITGTPSSSKTLTAFSETDGIVSATFGDISIAESQVTNLTTDLSNKADTSHTQAASTITAGTLAGQVNANATSVSTLGTSQVRNIYAGTTDMEEGVTALATGDIYVVYEV